MTNSIFRVWFYRGYPIEFYDWDLMETYLEVCKDVGYETEISRIEKL